MKLLLVVITDDDRSVLLDYQIEQIQEVGTHNIFICRIVAIQQT